MIELKEFIVTYTDNKGIHKVFFDTEEYEEAVNLFYNSSSCSEIFVRDCSKLEGYKNISECILN